MKQLRPGQIAALVGSALILVSCVVDWAGEGSFGVGVMDDAFGFTGIFVLLIALLVAGVIVVGIFAPQVALPSELLGFSLEQQVLSLSFAVTVYGLSVTFLNQGGTNLSKLGAYLAWIGGGAVIAGIVIERRAPAAPPSTG